MSKRVENPAQKFQRQMMGLGLGVEFRIPGREPVAVTTYCEKPGHGVTAGGSCAKCAADVGEVA